jgi:hypothetical protein
MHREGEKAEGNLTTDEDERCGLGICPMTSLKCGDLLSSMGRRLGHRNGEWSMDLETVEEGQGRGAFYRA